MEIKISVKKLRIVSLIAIAALAVILVIVFYAVNSAEPVTPVTPTPSAIAVYPCKPTFEDGDGPYYKPNAPLRTKLVPDKNNGEKLIVSGQLFYVDCITPVANAEIDIWQADETGKYQDDNYRGRIKTNNLGDFKFETVKPKGYGEGTGYRPPHIHFKIRINGNLIITSEMFFDDVKGKAGFDEAFIMKTETRNEGGKPVIYGTHNIYLSIKP